MSIHVTPHPNGWQVKHSNGQRPAAVFNTQKEAIKKGRQIAINQKEELVIHGRNGRIREKNSYGNDPFPPKG
ncbi:MAG TPA: DUF2188 domain-containing protein [Clostridia bacterium]